MSTNTALSTVGVIVIGRNEGNRLIDCLKSIRRRARRIVYVDSGSTDGSADTAERFGASVVRLDRTEPFTAARARNAGVDALMTIVPGVPFVQFIDGDCELVQDWINAATAFITQRPDVAVVSGRRRERYPKQSVYNHLCDAEWNTPIGEASACGGDALVRVEAFQAVGGFRAQLIAGEEPELCARLRARGWKVWRLDAEMTIHDAAITRFTQWWLRAVRSGYASAEVSLLHRRSRTDVWRKQTASAVCWGGLVPLAMALGAVIHPIALIGVAVYPIQICRIAIRPHLPSSRRWSYGMFMTLAKFAEFQGIAKFGWHCLAGTSSQLIEYKHAQ